MLFEAYLQGRLSHVVRHPHDRERNQLIRSGCVFIYEENESGIKRSSAGVIWSPSRILGKFPSLSRTRQAVPSRREEAGQQGENPQIQPTGQAVSSSNDGGYSSITSQSSSCGAEKSAIDMERKLLGDKRLPIRTRYIPTFMILDCKPVAISFRTNILQKPHTLTFLPKR